MVRKQRQYKHPKHFLLCQFLLLFQFMPDLFNRNRLELWRQGLVHLKQRQLVRELLLHFFLPDLFSRLSVVLLHRGSLPDSGRQLVQLSLLLKHMPGLLRRRPVELLQPGILHRRRWRLVRNLLLHRLPFMQQCFLLELFHERNLPWRWRQLVRELLLQPGVPPVHR